MGIKSLTKFLRGQCPDIFETIHISEYAFKKVAIDMQIYLYFYKIRYNDVQLHGKSGWLGGFIHLVAKMRKNGVHCIFVFDRPGYIHDKADEREQRKEARMALEERVYKLDEAIEKYETTKEADQILIDFQEKRKIAMPRLLRPGNVVINIAAIRPLVDKLRRQIINICPADYEAVRNLLDILNVPHFEAPLEAETACVDLCKRGIVDAVLTNDSDVLAYGANIFLSNIDEKNETCVRIKHDMLLKELNLTHDEFIDFCIMCGTDYNKNIFRVGPAKAFKYISDHKTIDKVGEKTSLDISVLKHVRVRELFKNYEQTNAKVPYCGTPDYTKLAVFIAKKNLRTDMGWVRSCFEKKTDIIIGSDNEIVFEE